MATASPPPSEILRIKNNEYYPYLASSNADYFVNVVNCKPTSERLQQLQKHETVQKADDDRVNNAWRDKVRIADKYEEHGPEFFKFLETFADM